MPPEQYHAARDTTLVRAPELTSRCGAVGVKERGRFASGANPLRRATFGSEVIDPPIPLN
jgi:hypothetical protein